MGSDKALLQLPDGETLVEHALALVSSVASEVRLLGSKAKYANLAWAGEIVEDIYSDHGPLGGIHAALRSSDTDLNLILAVDMPAITSDVLEYVICRAEESHALVTVPEFNGKFQPLCAVYRREFHHIAEQALKEDRNKVAAAFKPESTLVLRQEQLKAAGFSVEMFRNVNTADEWSTFNLAARSE